MKNFSLIASLRLCVLSAVLLALTATASADMTMYLHLSGGESRMSIDPLNMTASYLSGGAAAWFDLNGMTYAGGLGGLGFSINLTSTLGDPPALPGRQ